jgi:hypothetical protein
MVDTAAIYAAVVREFYTIDHTYNIDDPPNFPVIYLLETTDDGTGDPNAPQGEPTIIPEDIQQEVSRCSPDKEQWMMRTGCPQRLFG